MIFIQLLNRHTKKIAALWGSIFLFELVSPMAALALTAGPTAPEATSFEPVDTTDMVNPLTGSFTYNLPLMEVPGPEGGYPLSLSYHAGIRPDVEASWVGLGWSLNAGAINRNVSGIPDDFNEVSLKRRDYWAGGSRREYGIEVGFASAVNVGLVFASDTYQGFGVGASIGYGIRVPGSPANIGIDVGIGPYRGGYTGISVSSGYEVARGLNGVASIGLSTNFESISVGTGASLVKSDGGKAGTSLVSGSMSSSSNKPSLSAMGVTGSVFNKNSGKISTSSSGFGFNIPFGAFSIGASFRNTRYWIDETVEVASNGSLYTPVLAANTPTSYWDNRNFDNYRLMPDNMNVVDNADDHEFVGGTFPEYDNYTVSGQGIGGQIRPFLYQRTLSIQNSGYDKSFSYPSAVSSLHKAGVGFRFVNDFSNSYDQGLDDVINQSGSPSDTKVLPFSTGGQPDNRIGNELVSSKFIKYFTNDEIRNGTARAKGFIDVGNVTKGFARLTNGSTIGAVAVTKGGSQVGGFMITNESGVTYHYALPVYSYNEYSFNYTNKGGYRYSETNRTEPYAYTWLLTAVTGTDYVDRNGNGLVDTGDWGYWAAIDYGKWTGDYVWRTPADGTDEDLDQNYYMYTSGQKELYYINRIRTRTHTAIFEKEVRLDGKGGSPGSLDKKNTSGGFNEKSGQSLRLNRIYLLNNSDVSSVSENSQSANNGRINDLYTNVIDVSDIEKVGRQNIESRSIRIIDFGYSYDLSKNTLNSFNIKSPNVKFGKLTLDGVHFRGKGGVDLIPPTQFSYQISNKTFLASVNASNKIITSEPLQLGMMLEGANSVSKYYGMISKIETTENGQKLVTLTNGNALDSVGLSKHLRITKNPDYCRECHDIWGYYKGDVDKSYLDINKDFGRRTTNISAQGTDAWNLRTISSPTGSNIELEYESNEYGQTIFDRPLSYPIENWLFISANEISVALPMSKEEFEQHYSLGEKIDGVFREDLNNSEYHPEIYARSCKFNGWTSDGRIRLLFNTTINRSFHGGNIRLRQDLLRMFGGGVRIKTIKNKLLTGVMYQTKYNYWNRDNSPDGNVSTGITSYVPYGVEFEKLLGVDNEVKKSFKRFLNKNLNTVLKYAREIPAPGVMYWNVWIQNQVIQPNGDTQLEGYTENYYRALDKKMINRVVFQDTDFSKYNVRGINLLISDLTANVGDLLAVYTYDNSGRLIKEVYNKYLWDEINSDGIIRSEYRDKLSQFANQGLIVERFGEVRAFYRKGDQAKVNIVMAAREQYPSLMLSSTTIDHINRSSETKQNVAFDFFNGQPNQVLTKDSYGNRFMAETRFAYKDYAEMGSKLTNSSYKNMLTQVSSQVNYKVDAFNNKIGAISGSRTIWSKGVDVLTPEGTLVKQNTTTYGHIWRKQREDILEIPDEYANSGIMPSGQINSNWKPVNTINLYNVFSKGLEDYDRNNNYSANRYGYNNSKIVAGANFSKYKEIAFSGAEDELVVGAGVTGEVTRGASTVSTAAFHTGRKSLSVPAGLNGFEYTVPISALTIGRTYQASVWVKNSANSKVSLYYDIDGIVKASLFNSAQSTRKAGDWSLVNLEIPVTSGTQLKVYVKNDGAAASFVDDFRFHPKNASATAYVYDNFSGELTYILDHLNLFTRFEYDAVGRLIRTYKEQFGRAPYKTNEYQQNYGTNKSVYYNDQLTEEIRKNDCVTGDGTLVTYTVPAGKYNSTISKGDANNKAMTEVNQYGQQYANANGRCVSCKRYKVTIHRMDLQNLNLYVNYRDCNNTYRSSSYQNFETEADTGVYLVFYVCVNTYDTSIRFSHGQNQPSINLSAEIELVGDCN
ncbi:DUF5977 domain-containing protein [Sphingobacterium thalpophilum]|uniref:DUF5977 domain-containing protein n=1 Tax=Sphingobacterium thalpophilum TaxID=259 RepID=A0A4U9W2C5_9SPHI|nr:DUF5977 domain-containing protein [Sphingobacterium thalpophilum]VTR52796.1 Uncharacterised protein [Sphingobacterium thalpophilum]